MVLSNREIQLAEEESNSNSRLASLLELRKHTECKIVQCLAEREVQKLLGKNKNLSNYAKNNRIAHLDVLVSSSTLKPIQFSCSRSQASDKKEEKTLKKLREKNCQNEKLLADEREKTALLIKKNKHLQNATDQLMKSHKTKTDLLQSNINSSLDEIERKDVQIEELLETNDDLLVKLKQRDAEIDQLKQVKKRNENKRIEQLSKECDRLRKMTVDRDKLNESLKQKNKQLRDSFKRYKSSFHVKLEVRDAEIRELRLNRIKYEQSSSQLFLCESFLAAAMETIVEVQNENALLVNNFEAVCEENVNLRQVVSDVHAKDKEILRLRNELASTTARSRFWKYLSDFRVICRQFFEKNKSKLPEKDSPLNKSTTRNAMMVIYATTCIVYSATLMLRTRQK